MNYIEFKAEISPLEVGRDILIAQLSEIGFESFVETDSGLEAYIQEGEFDEQELTKIPLFEHEDFQISYQTKFIKDQNWNEIWEQSFEPIMVNNTCYVRAPFHEPVKDTEFDIVIEPKMSFGTGHHETTHLMIEELLGMNLENQSVLDMGCGTGVLAILSKKKGAGYVEAIDIDEWAYNNTLENVERNNTNDINVLLGGAECLKDQQFDVIIANINRNILTNDMSHYYKVLKSNGSLLLSGFLNQTRVLLKNMLQNTVYR